MIIVIAWLGTGLSSSLGNAVWLSDLCKLKSTVFAKFDREATILSNWQCFRWLPSSCQSASAKCITWTEYLRCHKSELAEPALLIKSPHCCFRDQTCCAGRQQACHRTDMWWCLLSPFWQSWRLAWRVLSKAMPSWRRKLMPWQSGWEVNNFHSLPIHSVLARYSSAALPREISLPFISKFKFPESAFFCAGVSTKERDFSNFADSDKSWKRLWIQRKRWGRPWGSQLLLWWRPNMQLVILCQQCLMLYKRWGLFGLKIYFSYFLGLQSLSLPVWSCCVWNFQA